MNASNDIGSPSAPSQIQQAGVSSHAPTVTREYKFRPASLRLCACGCGKFFKVYRGQNDCKKYFSHTCVQRAYRARHPKPKRVVDHSYGFFIGLCPGCGKDVWGTNLKQKYCPGSKCRTAAYRARRSESVATENEGRLQNYKGRNYNEAQHIRHENG